MKTLKKILLTLSIFFLTTLFIGAIYFFSVTGQVTLHEEKLLLPDVQICAYDGKNRKISSGFGFSTRETVQIDTLSKNTKNAFICVEDKRFYTHGGFDYKRIAKAILNNVKAGAFKEGASTISQQLVKNTHLTLEKTFNRKLKEVKLTMALERKFSKDQILEMYLNTIYFGHSCYGIECASGFYFGKRADELSLAEAATLAGLVRSPNNYSPFKNPQRCLTRRKTVLALMLQQNAIDKLQYEAALNEPLPSSPHEQEHGLSYLHFALDELEEIFERKQLPLGGKIEIYTYADLALQEKAKELTKSVSSGVTLAILDNETHGYKAFYSTVGDLRRCPASTIKPLLVYAPAFESGALSPATPILDEPIDYGGYQPKNYDGKYRGYISARTAISESLNIPAVKTLNAIGVQTASEYLQKLSLPVSKEDETLALALGGTKNGFTFSELLSAYSTFPSDGKFQKGSFLRKISVGGKTVYEGRNSKRAVFSPETAYLITDTLKTSVCSGTAKKLRSLPFSVAAKTGTAGTKKGNTDAYAFSYTPLDTVGVWLGNADNSPISATGGGEPTEISLSLHEALFQSHGNKIPDFEKPYQVKTCRLDRYGYERNHQLLLADDASTAAYQFSEIFNERYAPTERSTAFSSPSIACPTVEVTDKGIKILFPKQAPNFYEYEIVRKSKNKTTTLFKGKVEREYLDKQISPDTVCEYTVTPYFGAKKGATLALPAVFTSSLSTPNKLPDSWWEH